MKFTKMQGIGNDYVYVNCLEETVENPGEVARKVSDRHFGIGSDGLILIKPSLEADFEMDMYNSDGSQGAMCGNGIRCVAKYVYDYGLTDKNEISIATKSGIKYVKLQVENGKVKTVRVDMGAPILNAGLIPIVSENPQVINEAITAGGREYRMTGVSMGNPHCVVFLSDAPWLNSLDTLEIEKIGPKFENAEYFPDRVNTEFIEVLGRNHIRMRVWERGSGETLACGTGACAAAVASVLNGYAVKGEDVTVDLIGGQLKINYTDERVMMTGKAEVVFNGEVEV